MPSGHVRMIRLASTWAMGTLFVAGCGGAVEPGSSLAIQVLRAELTANITRARIDLHPSDRRCTMLERAGPRVRGAYTEEVDLTSLNEGDKGEGAIDSIRPSTYTLVVWGFIGADPTERAYGCAEDVVILEGKRTNIPLRLVAR